MSTLTQEAASELFRQPPDRYLAVDQAEVAHRVIGTGPDVLFVHGWPFSGASFRGLLPHLAPHVTCHVIDLPGTGSSRWTDATPLSLEHHIDSVRRVVDSLGFDEVAVVGNDAGGMIVRHALAGDTRVRAMGLINTEQPQGLGWRFKSFLAVRSLPRLESTMAWALDRRRLRNSRLLFGDAFVDRSFIDGEFEEFVIRPFLDSQRHRAASIRLLRSFDGEHVDQLAELHRRIDVPVQLVWGVEDPFFPIARAREMVSTFPNARLTEIEGASVFSQEERPAEVAEALLPVLTGGW